MPTKTDRKKDKPSSNAGTYVYDKELGRVVKVSDQVPKVASRGRRAPEAGPCGRTECGGGRCAGGG